MTVEKTTAGAVSHVVGGWHAINWQKAHAHVRRLQVRIVKATQEGRWNKVKSLQRLLTRSFSAKAIAVKRVTENQGKKTPGVDGEIWDTPQDKMEAIGRLKQHGYQPQPLKRIYIPKRNGKKRPLGIPTMIDRAMQALWLLALEPIAETTADPTSFGFRPMRSCADAIGKCFSVLSKRNSAKWVLEGDIKSCFDRIDHNWLIENIPMDKTILRKWLKSGYLEGQILHDTEDGTPQGGIISPVLANMALDGLHSVLLEHFPKPKTGYNAKVNYIRYADDFIITGASDEVLENDVKPIVEAFLRERGLELSQEKTQITHINDGFDFLSQNIRKYNDKLIIKPSKHSVQDLLDKVRGIIKKNKQMPVGKLLLLINPVIRGWALYHRHICSSKTFSRIDQSIFEALWHWAKRRHPNKSKTWIKDKYFPPMGSRSWMFQGEYEGRLRWLYHCSDVKIERHVMIRGEANPFDPEWETYFEKRLSRHMENKLYGRRQLIRIWKSQQGECLVCQQKITAETGWHLHHIKPRVLGGLDKDDNLVLLHPNCHRQVHNLDLKVEKPRPTKGVKKA
jgi:RNA-directed DNA polymerase